jgi:hypothetical protein
MVNQEGSGLHWILDLKTGRIRWIVMKRRKLAEELKSPGFS